MYRRSAFRARSGRRAERVGWAERSESHRNGNHNVLRRRIGGTRSARPPYKLSSFGLPLRIDLANFQFPAALIRKSFRGGGFQDILRKSICCQSVQIAPIAIVSAEWPNRHRKVHPVETHAGGGRGFTPTPV